MSWSVASNEINGHTYRRAIERLDIGESSSYYATYPHKESREQLMLLKKCALDIISSGVVGGGPWRVYLSGHATSAHTIPDAGIANESISLSIVSVGGLTAPTEKSSVHE
jgi:hypothetical protein